MVITLANLGNAYGDLGDALQMKELLERALRIEEREYYGREPTHPQTNRLLVCWFSLLVPLRRDLGVGGG